MSSTDKETAETVYEIEYRPVQGNRTMYFVLKDGKRLDGFYYRANALARVRELKFEDQQRKGK